MQTYIIYDNVILGEGAKIEEFVIIGKPITQDSESPEKTIIGSKAIIRSHTVIYAGNMIGNNFSSGHAVLIRESNHIGNDVSVGTHSVIEHHVYISNGVRLHSNVFIPEYSILEENCWVGPGVVFTNARYPRSRNIKNNLKGPHIKQNAIIGAASILLPGVTIGKKALIGAGAVIVEDVPDYAVVVGNPGKIIKRIDEIIDYE